MGSALAGAYLSHNGALISSDQACTACGCKHRVTETTCHEANCLGNTAIYALLFFIAHHPAGFGAVAITLAALAVFPLLRLRRPIAATGALGVALLMSVANNLFGSGLANALVYRHGMVGQATTIAVADHAASAEHKGTAGPLAYELLIATPDGRTVHSRLHDGDRVVYRGPGADVSAPAHPAQVGDVFDVRYLPDDPRAFVITAGDRAVGERRCQRLAQNVARVSLTLGADRARPDSRPDYVAAVEAYLDDGCGGEGRDLQALRHTLRQTLAAAGDAGRWPGREATSR